MVEARGRTDAGSADVAPAADEETGLPARRAALRALRQVEEDEAWSNQAVPRALRELPAARDRGFAAHLAYETLRWQGTLDRALALTCRRPLEQVEPALRRVLRLGATQLLISDVPDRATVATSATLAREQVPRRRADGAAGFVNGVLRGLARQRHQLPWPSIDEDPVEHLALTTGHPAWVVVDLLPRYGVERTRRILAADDVAPGLTLRATGDRDALIEELNAARVAAVPGATPEAVRAPGTDPRELAAVREGRAVPQDEASMRVAHATGAGAGTRALDLCAGPGGKTTHLAALGATVTAVELHEHRAELVREAAAVQGVEVAVVVGDARRAPLPADARFDVVLLDAPCTGLGTGRRRPEVRWRQTPDDARSLAGIQAELLTAAARWVAPGGRLTYAVCTWTAVETVELVDGLGGQLTAAGLEPEGSWQLLPDVDDTDGMFIASWTRSGSDDR